MNKYVIIAIVIAILALGGAFFASRQASAPESEVGIQDSSRGQTKVDSSAGQTTPGAALGAPSGGVVSQPAKVIPETKPAPAPSPAPAPAPVPKTYTLADVAKHSTPSSCWSAINGMVYDLTRWISDHPGGEQAILSICGIDGSSAFDGQHGGESKPERILAGYEIAPLAK